MANIVRHNILKQQVRIKRYNEILELCQEPKLIIEIAKHFNNKCSAFTTPIDRLYNLGYITIGKRKVSTGNTAKVIKTIKLGYTEETLRDPSASYFKQSLTPFVKSPHGTIVDFDGKSKESKARAEKLKLAMKQHSENMKRARQSAWTGTTLGTMNY